MTMKKIFIIAISLATTIAIDAQIMNVTGIERLNVPSTENTVTQAVAISPQGDYLLLSTDTKQGLVKWNMADGKASTLTSESGTGGDVHISPDGQQVVYSEVSYKDNRCQQAVKSIDLTNGKKQTLVKPTRHLQGFAVDNKTAVTMNDGKMKKHALKGGDATLSRPVLTRHHLKLYITRNGATTLFAPNGADERYIWASLSPDGNRVLYYVSHRGAFVSDIDGSNVIAMGDITAPKWWDDNTIVGMDELDDEYTIISSRIVARTLDGEQQVLTGDDLIATYPLPSQQAGKIAFSTPDGSIYLITVK